MRSRIPSSLLGSIAAHGVLVLAVLLVLRARPPAPPEKPPETVEIDYATPPTPPAAQPAPEPTPPEPTPAQPPPREPPPAALAHVVQPTHHALSEEHPVQPEQSHPDQTSGGTIESGQPSNPPSGPTQPQTGNQPPNGGRILTASELYGNVDALSNRAVRDGVINLGPPGVPRASRDLWGGDRPGSGSSEERARAAASQPTIALLEGSHHMQAAGTMTHDRTVARRAEEEFDPINTVANLEAAVQRAPSVSLPQVTHVSSAGEAAMAEGFDQRMGSSFSGMSINPGMSAPSFHVLRADVEIDQSNTGAVLATRVVRRSGSASFDAAALNAIRQAAPQAENIQSDAGRRSRWSFEVSEAQGLIAQVRGGGNEGWRMLPAGASGVQLRVRVRMIAAQALNHGT